MPVPMPGTPLCPARAGVYLGCPARGHSEPLTVTRQLLPAERWVPRSERWVPPPWGPNGGCKVLMWGSWAETASVGWVGEPTPSPLPNPARGDQSYHKGEAAEGGRALDVEAGGSGGFLHGEDHVSWAPHRRRAPRLQLAHQHIHKVLAAGGGQGSVGR